MIFQTFHLNTTQAWYQSQKFGANVPAQARSFAHIATAFDRRGGASTSGAYDTSKGGSFARTHARGRELASNRGRTRGVGPLLDLSHADNTV